jgi:hypothetical protein
LLALGRSWEDNVNSQGYESAKIIDFSGTARHLYSWSEEEPVMVGDLEKLSKALTNDTPEKLVERQIRDRAAEIRETLRRGEPYIDRNLGVRITADVDVVRKPR